MKINRYTITMLCTFIFTLTGCQSLGVSLGVVKPTVQPIESAILSINEQLTNNIHFSVLNKSIVSSTFVWSDTLTTSTTSANNQDIEYLGALLQESVSTHLSQAGADFLEIKSANAIYLTPTSELFLSRDSKKIASNTMADYVLTGIMTPTDYGIIVNVKLISLHDKKVASAARQVIAAVSSKISQKNSSTLKDGMLYRSNAAQGSNND